MLVLENTDLLEVITTTANALDVAAFYADNTAAAFTPDKQVTTIAAAATTTFLSAPAAATTRNTTHVSFHARGGANALTVRFNNGAAFNLVTVSLAASERLEYENGKGWSVYDSAGQFKQSIAAAAGSVALTALANQAANTFVVNATGGAAAPTAVAPGAQGILLQAAANIVAATAAAGQLLQRTVAGGNLGFSAQELGSTSLGAAIVANAAATNATTNLSVTGSLNILAGSTVVGSTFLLHGWCSFLHTAATTPTITAELLVNAAVVATAILTPIATAATFGFEVKAILTIRTTGAGGTAMAQCGFNQNFSGVGSIDHSVNTATFAIDTTVARSLQLQVRMTTAVAANTLTVTNGYIQRIS